MENIDARILKMGHNQISENSQGEVEDSVLADRNIALPTR